MNSELQSRCVNRLGVAILSLVIFVPASIGQQNLKGRVISLPIHSAPNQSQSAGTALTSSLPVTPFPQWSYSVVGYDGISYSGSLMGRSPYNHGKTTTTIPLQIVPLIITVTDANGPVVYDATAPDSCTAQLSAVNVVTGSPLFNNNSWTMNGQNIGNTQYVDADTRAEFWSLVSGTPYHLIFQPQILPAQSLSFSGINDGIGCGTGLGIVFSGDLDTALLNLITGPLAAQVNVGTMPLFVLKNVVLGDNSSGLLDSCCILGYHGATQIGQNVQLYSVADVDTGAIFASGFTLTLSHELAEAVNDPSGNNPTPSWGHSGQTYGCQTNLEVGDPLSTGGETATLPFTLTAANGLTYELQELAFFSWFYGAPSLGAGGLYSDHGTFTQVAAPCS